MARIFISYSRKDDVFARKLAHSLSDLGLDIWIDVEDIPAGVNWSNAIQEGLRICDTMLVIVTPASVASTNVADEWQYFHSQRKPIIPLRLEPADVHYQLKRIQYVDFYTQDYSVALKQLHEAIQDGDKPAEQNSIQPTGETKMTGDQPESSKPTSVSRPPPADRGDSDEFNMIFQGPIYGGQFARVITNNGGVMFNFSSGEQDEIKRALDDVRNALNSLNLSPKQQAEAEQEVQTLYKELLASTTPSDIEIKSAGDSLLKKVPKITGALAALFTNQAVGKVVEAAGDVAVEWVESHFSNSY